MDLNNSAARRRSERMTALMEALAQEARASEAASMCKDGWARDKRDRDTFKMAISMPPMLVREWGLGRWALTCPNGRMARREYEIIFDDLEAACFYAAGVALGSPEHWPEASMSYACGCYKLLREDAERYKAFGEDIAPWARCYACISEDEYPDINSVVFERLRSVEREVRDIRLAMVEQRIALKSIAKQAIDSANQKEKTR